jgi:hypothetical protein
MRRNAATLLLTLVLVVVTSPAAQAADGDTWANTPTDGAGSIMDPGPTVKGTGDPFAKHPTTSIYDTFGFGFMEWKSVPQDPSLLQRLLDHGVLGPGGVVASQGAQKVGELSPKSWADNAINAMNTLGLMVLSMLLGLTALLLRLAYQPDWLHLLDPFQRIGQRVFGRGLFLGLEWVTLCCAGIWLIAHARRARFKEVANEGSWVAFTVVLGFIAVLWPFTIAPAVDHALTTGMGTVNAQAAGFDPTGSRTATEGATGTLHRALGYEVWCSGLVGRDAGRQIADTYCPRLLKASAFSYQEMAATASDPKARADLSNQKFEDYKRAVSDLCDASPTACANVVGDRPWSRFGTVALAYAGAASALPFTLISAGLLAYCLVLLRVALALLPLLVLIGGFPPAKRVVLKLGEIVLVAFRSAILMGVGCTGLLVAIGGLMSPVAQANVIVSYVIVLLLTVAFWVIFKPHRAVMAAAGKIPKGVRKLRWGTSSPSTGGAWPAGPESDPATGNDGSSSKDYAKSRPVEAEKAPSMPKAAWEGAKQGAMKTAAVGLATGGTVTLAGVAAGAAKGAGAAAAAEKVRASQARERMPAELDPLPVAPAPAQSDVVLPSRVYVPGEPGPDFDRMRMVPPSSVEVGRTKVDVPTQSPVYTGRS